MKRAERAHMLWSRAGFGRPLASANDHNDPGQVLRNMLRGDSALEPIEVLSVEEWQASSPKALKAAGITGEELKGRLKSYREKAGELGIFWMERMVAATYPLQEKMALFWHGHFATRAGDPLFDQMLLQQFRVGALGKFGDLLQAVTKSPGMLKFLNNQQNRKAHPNENFARELMELFTLGCGHYTETDIREAARAFTGWMYDSEGAFVFREKQHDSGRKTFLGQTGTFTGDDILRILLEQKQTAAFITRKIYRFFVNDDITGEAEAWISRLTNTFYASGYDIGLLLKEMFSADWFYRTENRGAHIKSPVELIVGLQRTIPTSFHNERTLVMLQRVLGQQLFYPPNVAGWPGGRAWIDASSLVIRMSLPEAIYGSKELVLRAKEVDAEMTDGGRMRLHDQPVTGGNFRVGKADADWSSYLRRWSASDDSDLPGMLAAYLLPLPIRGEQLQLAVKYAVKGSKEDFIKSLTIRLMSLPEYQLA